MIRISYQFATPEEAIAFLAKANNITHLSREIVAPEEVVTPPPPNKRRGRPASRSEPPTSPQLLINPADPAPTPEPVKAAPKAPNAPVQAVAAVGADEVRAALRAVFNGPGGAKAAADVLTSFGAQRISDIKPDQYTAFFKACKL